MERTPCKAYMIKDLTWDIPHARPAMIEDLTWDILHARPSMIEDLTWDMLQQFYFET